MMRLDRDTSKIKVLANFSKKIIEKFNESGENRVRLELTAETPREQSLAGEAVIALD